MGLYIAMVFTRTRELITRVRCMICNGTRA